MSSPPNFDLAVQHTFRVASLLKDRRDDDADWQDQLDFAFLNAVFDHNYQQPYTIGPDGLRYYQFVIPQQGNITPIIPLMALDEMVEWGSGAVILNREAKALYVYSPGDVVAMKLYGKTIIRWKGEWAGPPDTDAYSRGGNITTGTPGEELMPPLAARCADFYLKHWMKAQPNLADRTPGVSTIRLASKTEASQSSELVFNIFSDEIPETGQGNSIVDYIAHFFPRHIAKRIIVGSRLGFASLEFTQLAALYEKAGMTEIAE